MYPKSSPLLLQNCDLPPPLKVFAAGDEPQAAAAANHGIFDGAVYFDCCGGGGEWGKSGILKALRLSQTRAREAERRRAQMEEERDGLLKALVEESMQLLAHRQWVRLLELQVSQMRFQWTGGDGGSGGGRDDDGNKDGGGGTIWAVALALCLGFVFGFKYYI